MRFVVDEHSLCLNGIAEDLLADELLGLATLIEKLRTDDRAVEIISGWGSFNCLGSDDIATVLSSSRLIDRDVRNLLLGLLGKCPAWDSNSSVVLDEAITVSGEPYASFGTAFAAAQVRARAGTAVLTTRHTGHRGALRVNSTDAASVDVHFLRDVSDLLPFYRSLFELEDIGEQEFFDHALTAFPELRFADGLSFSGFEGSYINLRPQVVRHLAALNDDFSRLFRTEKGNSERISVYLGIDVSIEGGTRASAKLMSLRDVVVDDGSVRCEWHSKLEPHRNRIHFHPGSPRTNHQVFIGIFVKHLPT